MKSNRLKISTLIFFSISAAVHAGLFYAYYDDFFGRSVPVSQARSIAVSIQPVSLPEMVVESTPEPEVLPVPASEPVISPIKKDILLADNSVIEAINQVEKTEEFLKQPGKSIVKKNTETKLVKKPAVKLKEKPSEEQVEKPTEQLAQIDQEMLNSANEQRRLDDINSEADGKADYLVYLYQKIKDHKFYPSKAKRWRAEGRVTVAFSITRDGSITDLKISESSGNRYLDKAALTTIRQTRPLQQLPVAIKSDRWDLTIPIEYLLTN